MTVSRFIRSLVCLAFGLAAASLPARDEPLEYDLVVIEATPGGIATAVRAARQGLKVLLVNRTQHLGGILSSGLGVWDTLYEGKRSPVYDETRQAIMEHYRTTYGEGSPQHMAALPGKTGHTNGRFEPRIAEQILTGLVARESNITVLKGYVPSAVTREGRLLRSVTLQAFEGKETQEVRAWAFADCTYEGDLLPLSKVAYRVGRESREEFQEPHAGKIYMRPSKTPPDAETAFMAEEHAKLKLRHFPGFQEIVLPESTGEGDRNVQAFNFRTILTSDPANRLPVEKPADYDPAFLSTLEFGSIVSPLPNQKIGWNRPQLVGPHQEYVEGGWQARLKVMDLHWQAAMGLLYYLQNDPSVPETRRQFFSAYGLAKDEFADHGHRPHEIYVREARRLTGRHIITQHDFTLSKGTQRAPVHADSVAFAEWYMDTHACTLDKVEGSLDEGKMMLHHETFPAQVPYRALFSSELDNLIVPVCLSATHVAWGAIRLEPVWMQIGESAGYACALAKEAKISPADLNPATLVRALAESRSMVSFFNDVDITQKSPAVTAAQILAGRGFFHDYNARLDEPVKTATAQVWLQSALAPSRPGEKVMAEVAAAEAGTSPPLDKGTWNQWMKAENKSELQIKDDVPVTRGMLLTLLAW